MTNEQLSQHSGSPELLNTSTSSKYHSETNSITSPKLTSEITPVTSSSNSPTPLSENKMKRHREESCDREDSRSSPSPPPTKTAKMGYSIMNLLAKDKKEKVNPANKENSIDSRPISPAPSDSTPTSNQQQPLNPFFLNPFLAAAAAAAQASNQNTPSNLLNNISNLAMLSKNQSPEMWPWFNMAAMSALYGLDKGYPNLFQAPIDNFRNSQNQIQTANGQQKEEVNFEENYQTMNRLGLNKTSTPHSFPIFPRRPNELINRSGSQSSNSIQSSNSPPVSTNKFTIDEHHRKSENRKLVNRSFDEEEHEHDNGRMGYGGASMGDDDDLEDDNDVVDEDDDIDGSNNGDSFDNMRKKKTRTVFSRNQVFQLESTFDMKRYLSSSERSSLANSLQLTETQIKIWFQNRRNKWKRQLAAEIEANSSLPNTNQQQQQTQHQLSSSTGQMNNLNNQQRNQIGTNNQRVVRVPVLYQSNERQYVSQDMESNIPSSSSSTHSSLTSPSNSNFNNSSVAAAVLSNMANSNQASVNAASLLSPSMLAAAAAASSLYYAAAAQQAQPSQFQSINLSLASNANGSKQSLSSIL